LKLSKISRRGKTPQGNNTRKGQFSAMLTAGARSRANGSPTLSGLRVQKFFTSFVGDPQGLRVSVFYGMT